MTEALTALITLTLVAILGYLYGRLLSSQRPQPPRASEIPSEDTVEAVTQKAEPLDKLSDSQNLIGKTFIRIDTTFTAFVWPSKRNEINKRMKDLASKPIIFENDSNPNNVPFYPRVFLENISKGFMDIIIHPFQELIRIFKEFIKIQLQIIFNKEYPLRTFGYLFFLLCFFLFAYADTIVLTGLLSTLGLITGEIPIHLLNYALAVGVATFLSTIIGFLSLSQTFADTSELMHWSDSDSPWKRIANVITLLIVFIGISITVLLGISRLVALGLFETTPTTDFIIQIGLNNLILLNSILPAILIFNEAFRGVLVILISIQWLFLGVIWVLEYIFTIIGYVIPFLVEVVLRLLYFLFYLLQYLIIVPFLATINLLLMPFRWMYNISHENKDG